jgi:D-3-phosphoglycerate dehydrogenase / 2-oxoglutarate reductase
MNGKNFKVVRLNTGYLPIIVKEKEVIKRVGGKIIEIKGNEFPSNSLNADAIMVISASIKSEIIDKLNNCKIIARIGIGTDNIDIGCATKNKIIVTNVPGFCKNELADHTIALLLSCARKIVLQDKKFRNGNYWSIRNSRDIKRIAGKKIGLIGFGELAQEVAKRAQVFGLDVLAYDPYKGSESFKSMIVTKVKILEDLLSKCDFISIHVPLTDETYHLIGEKELKCMKDDAIIINTSRGSIINEDELFKALSNNIIGGAGLDVFEKMNLFEEKPTKKYNPLFKLDNVVITPHSAASSREAYDEVRVEAANEVARVLSGKMPNNCVNPEVIPYIKL